MERQGQFCTTCKRTTDSGCEDCKYFVPEIEIETMDVKSMDDEKASKLIGTCSQNPEIYNRISRELYSEFGLQGAELCLLITYFVIKEGDET